MLGRLFVARHGIRDIGGEVIEDLFDGGRLLPSLERFDEVVGEVAVPNSLALPRALVCFARCNDEAPLARQEHPGGLLIDAQTVDAQSLFAPLRRLAAEA